MRGAQKGRTKLPESFWQAAVDLAKQYGVFRTAQPLRLDYTRLKQRLIGAPPKRKSPPPAPKRKSPPPAFVELVRAQPAEMEEYVIEFESAIAGRDGIRAGPGGGAVVQVIAARAEQ